MLLPVIWFAWGLTCAPCFAEVRLGVTSQVEYNDNLFLEPSEGTSDFLFRVFPWVDLTERGRRHQVNLAYRPSYTWYDRNTEYNQAGHNADLGLSVNVTRHVDLFFDNHIERSEEGTSDRQSLQGASRLPVTNLSSTLAALWATGRDESFRVSCTGESLDYDSQSPSEDSREARGEVTWRTQVGDHRFLTLEADYVKGWYDVSSSYRQGSGTLGAEHGVTAKKRLFGRVAVSTYTSDGRTDYVTVNPYVGVAGEFPRGRYDLGAGVLIREEEDADTTCRLSVVGTAEIEKQWRRGDLSASLETGHEENYIDFDTPGFTTFVTGLVTGGYLPAKGWRVDGSCEVRGDDYLENRAGREDRQDVTVRLTGGAEYQLMKQATVRLDCHHRLRRSNLAEHEYDENSIVLTLNMYTR
ncbi:consensus disorder prediction [Desulfoluna spongiiphila]|nr:consensus disorder prediction [Desulfoluna spongiiphila]